VLLVAGDGVKIGAPFVSGALVKLRSWDTAATRRWPHPSSCVGQALPEIAGPSAVYTEVRIDDIDPG